MNERNPPALPAQTAQTDRLMQNLLTRVIETARQQSDQTGEPQLRALLERTAEVLTGLRQAYQHCEKGQEKAWERSTG